MKDRVVLEPCVVSVLCLLGMTACGTKHPTTVVQVSMLRPVAFTGTAAPGTWADDHGALVNETPGGPAPGPRSESLALANGFVARDLQASCRVTVTRGATAGIAFRVQEEGG